MPAPAVKSAAALVIGGGPAGLMAAEALLRAGVPVLLAEQKPTLARKFLMAGKSGLNLTKAVSPEACLAAYGTAAPHLAPMIAALPPEAVRAWAEGLGQEMFAGSTGRVFPRAMKASPLLRAWRGRLAEGRFEAVTRWRWTGWTGAHARFDTPDGPARVAAEVTVLAMGGASWRRLGSDGAWADILGADGHAIAPFAPANAGLDIAWSEHMRPHLGQPLKNVVLSAGGTRSRGEVVLGRRGLEGGALYPLSPALREGAALTLDLLPDLGPLRAADRLARPSGGQSVKNRLRRALGLTPQAIALAQEVARPLPADPRALAAALTALELPHRGLRPLDEAISTAGGLSFDALDPELMLRARPGTFAAGEMLDWEAPTGGYLLTGCLATGLWAGRHAAAWHAARSA